MALLAGLLSVSVILLALCACDYVIPRWFPRLDDKLDRFLAGGRDLDGLVVYDAREFNDRHPLNRE